jgi:putative ABC transport system permease protein
MRLALRNVFRQRARSATTLAAISLGVAALILSGGFVQDIFFQLREAIIHSQTGHLQISRKGYAEGHKLKPEDFRIEHAEALKASLAAEPGVQLALARLNFSGMVNNGKRDLGIIGEGVEPDAEHALGTYLHYIEGRALTDKDEYGIVVGEGVARSLGLKVGDRLTLVISLSQGAVNTLDFELLGIFQSFSKEFDARAVRIPLAATQKLMDVSTVDQIVLVLNHTEETEKLAERLKTRLEPQDYELTTWQQQSDFYEKTVELYDRQFGVLRLIILLMVLLSVANSINMTLFERTREFGTMQALGNRPVEVFRLILTESALTGILGTSLGVLLGCLGAVIISAIGISMPPPPNANVGYDAAIRLIPSEILLASLIGITASCLAAIIPARRASKLHIVDALRQGT